MTKPPRLAEWLLRRLRRSPDAFYIAGDLAEGFAKRSTTSPQMARRWYWSQVLRLFVHQPTAPAMSTRARAGWPAWPTAVLHAATSGLRTVCRRPVPSLVSALVVMLGVTATTTLATVTYSVLYRPLPWPEPHRLVRLWETRGGRPMTSLTYLSSSLDAWRNGAIAVDAIGAYLDGSLVTVLGPDGAERLSAARVALDLLPMLGAVPVEGRLLDPRDEMAVVVSASLADRQFGGPGAVGRTIDLNGRPYMVVGVLPDEFRFPSGDTEVWIPHTWRAYEGGNIGSDRLQVMARLAPGVSIAQAVAEATDRARRAPPLDPIAEHAYFGAVGPPTIVGLPLLELETQEVRPALLVLVVGVVLLMATALASVAGMQVARTSDRRRELAIRAAIGAGRGRLALQVLAEAFWAAAPGGAGALLAVRWILGAAPRLLPADFPRLDAVAFDSVAAAFMAAGTLAAALLIGLLPALEVGRTPLAPTIKDDGTAPVGLGLRSAAGRGRSLMIAGQMAVAVTLLVAAGLIGKTVLRLVSEDLGYAPERILVARLIGIGDEDTPAVSADTFRRLTERLESLPGVTGVAVATALPFQHDSGRQGLGLRLRRSGGAEAPASISENSVTPSYFRLLGMRLVTGRVLTDEDYAGDGASFVVNKTFAERFLGDDPVGPFPNGGRVVGVVEDVRDRGDAGPVEPQMFTLYRDDQTRLLQPSAVYLQTTGDPEAAAPLARGAVRSVDNRLNLDTISTMDAELAAQVARPRLYAWLVGLCAGFALLIATVGLFGVLSYAVSRRTREIGVRCALGATPSLVARGVMAHGLALATTGAVAGLAAAAVAARYLTSLLYQVTPYDPWVFTGVPVGLLLVAALACYLPARRASRIDPLTALRSS